MARRTRSDDSIFTAEGSLGRRVPDDAALGGGGCVRVKALELLGLDRASASSALGASFATALLAVSSCIAYPTIIFNGELAQYYSLGLGQALLSAGVLGIILALMSSYKGAVAYPQSQPLVVIAIIAHGVAVTLQSRGVGDQIGPTLVVMVVLCSIASGLFFTGLGMFRLGDLIRYIPFPVIGGFLAAIGWILVKAALSVTMDLSLRLEHIPMLLSSDAAFRWLPGVGLGTLLWYLQRQRAHWLNVPVILIGSVALFWIVALAAGQSPATLRGAHWLVGPLPAGDLWSPTRHIQAFAAAAWWVFPGFVIEFATLLSLSAISVLLAASSVELAVRQDVDLNRELRSTGLGNVATGLLGGLPGYVVASASITSYKMNAPVRFVGLATGTACLLVLLFGASLVSLVPRLTISLLLFFTGLGLLTDWLYRAYSRMAAADYLVLVSVFLVAVFVGFMEGIGVGVVFGLVTFVIKYSRVGVARRMASGSLLHSNVERPDALKKILQQSGDQIETITLQGYIFFGTANTLVEIVKARMLAVDRLPLTHLLLDFSLVNGLDASAAAGFTRILQYSEQMGFKLLLANPSEEICAIFRREKIFEGQHPNVRVFPDLDRALEWSENKILAAQHLVSSGDAVPIVKVLRSIFDDPSDAVQFHRILEPHEFEEGQVLVEQGTLSDDLFYIESGQVMIRLSLPDGSEMRVRTMDAGTFVGEVAFYLGVPRSASVVGTQPGCALRLSRASIEKLRAKQPRVATAFHEYMARTLADKLVDTTRLLSVLRT